MSKSDPFNFNDIYAQMGADNLVRKPMAEMKKATPSPSAPAQPVTALRPQLTDPTKPASGKPQASTFSSTAFVDLDFLSGAGSKPAAAAAAPAPAPAAPIRPTPTPSPPQQAAPAAPAHTTGFGLDDLFSGVASTSSPPYAAPSAAAARVASNTPAAGSDDPFAAFETVDGAMPVVTSAPHTSNVTPNASLGDLTTAGLGATAPTPTPLQPYPPIYEAAPSTGVQYSYAAAPATHKYEQPSYSETGGSAPLPQRSGADSRAPAGRQARGGYAEDYGGDADAFGGYQQPGYSPGERPQPPRSFVGHAEEGAPRGYSERQAARQGSATGGPAAAAEASRPAAPRGIGIASFLTDLGKKAARAAQAGLHQLEKAMEDAGKPSGPPARGWSHAMQGGTSEEEERAAIRRMVGASDSRIDSEDQGAARALDIAVRIGELPVEVRGDALAQLSPGMRSMVEEILREQLMLEEEDHAQRQAGAADAAPMGYRPVGGLHGHDDDSHGFAVSVESTPDRASGAGQRYGEAAYSPAPRAQPASPPPPPPPAVTDLLGAGDDDLTSIRQQQQQQGLGTASSAAAPTGRGHDTADFFAVPAASATAAGSHRFGDFVSAGSSGLDSGGTAPVATAAAAADHGHEFGDFLSPSASGGGPVPAPAAPLAHAADPSDLNDFFSGGAAAAAPAPATTSAAGTSNSGAAAFGGVAKASSGPKAPAMDLIADLHSEGLDTSAHQGLYEDVEGHDGEPELRRQLRAARLAERNAKMRAALAEKLAKDEEEARRKEEQVQLKDQYKQAVDVWKNKNKGNIRGLLGSLQTVLWDNSGWVTVSVGDLLEINQVKKVYMKANLLVHPDKVRQRNGTPEQVAIADMVFDVLKDAWNSFRG